MLTTDKGNFNLNRLRGLYSKADPEVRRELFGHVADLGAMDDLMTVIGSMRDADLNRNFSNTAYTLLTGEFGQAAASDVAKRVQTMFTGGAGASTFLYPTETVLTGIAAYLMSEAIYNPPVARALASLLRGQTYRKTEAVGRSLGRAVSRLFEEEPEDFLPEEGAPEPGAPTVAPPSPVAGSGWRSRVTQAP
jgi:hypothetical protein